MRGGFERLKACCCYRGLVLFEYPFSDFFRRLFGERGGRTGSDVVVQQKKGEKDREEKREKRGGWKKKGNERKEERPNSLSPPSFFVGRPHYLPSFQREETGSFFSPPLLLESSSLLHSPKWENVGLFPLFVASFGFLMYVVGLQGPYKEGWKQGRGERGSGRGRKRGRKQEKFLQEKFQKRLRVQGGLPFFLFDWHAKERLSPDQQK